jgi:two-component sensor histidine kinase
MRPVELQIRKESQMHTVELKTIRSDERPAKSTVVENGGAARLESLLLVEEIRRQVVDEYTLAIASVSVDASRIVDPSARATLLRAATRLGAFAEAHRALQPPVADTEIDLGDYLDQVCSALSDADLRDRGVKLILLEDDVRLAPARCWRVGLIIAELIRDSARHGGAVMIVVEVRLVGGEVRCQVADNSGPGPDPRPWRGHHLVESLAEELGGDVDWRFGANGVTATLNFPLMPPPVVSPNAGIVRCGPKSLKDGR